MADWYVIILKYRGYTGTMDCGAYHTTLSDARNRAISALKEYGWTTYYAVLYQKYYPPYTDKDAVGTVHLRGTGHSTSKLRAVWIPKKDSKHKQYFINKNGSLGIGFE